MNSVTGEEVYSGTLTSGSSYSENVCVAPGCYSISVGGGSYDYEISWSVSVTEGGDAVLEGGAPETTYLSVGSDESCSVDNFMMGCMDPWATNYDETATSDDGSCLYPVSLKNFFHSDVDIIVLAVRFHAFILIFSSSLL